MIEVNGITKTFGTHKALDNLSCTIGDGIICGLVGSNGAGKSTLLRILSGIYLPDTGTANYDGQKIYNNPPIKDRIVFVSDDIFFLPQSSIERMASFYAATYPRFSKEKLFKMVELFGLNPKAALSTFSKGTRRQAATLLALSTGADLLLLDETFDGLDPVKRELVKKAIYAEIADGKTSVILASHSLRELEDTCDQLALLHDGGLVFESEIGNLKTSLVKVQVAFKSEYDKTVFDGLDILSYDRQGSVANAILRANKEEVQAILSKKNPLILETLPLSLEEVFIHEMEALGYSFDASILGGETA